MITDPSVRLRAHRRQLPRATLLGLSGAAAMVAGLLAAPPAPAADFTVSTGAELVAAINDANAAPGPDTITIDGTVELTADLPAITDELTLQGVNDAVIDGAGASHTGLKAEDIAALTIEDLSLKDIKYNAVHVYGVDAFTATNLSVANASGYGVYVYGFGAGSTATLNNVTAANARYDGVRLRLFSGTTAQLEDVHVTDSGRVEAAQPLRERGGFSVNTSHNAAATLSNVSITETGSTREIGDDSSLLAGLAINSSGTSSVTVTGVTATGPLETALQLTAADTAAIDVKAAQITGDNKTEYAFDVEAGDSATVDLADFRAEESGAFLGELADAASLNLSRGLFERSGIEAAFAVTGPEDQRAGSFTAHELTLRNAPARGMVISGLAEANLSSVSVVNNGLVLTQHASLSAVDVPALTLVNNVSAQLTNATISDNHTAGVGIGVAEPSDTARIGSTTIADNAHKELLLFQLDDQQPSTVHVRNSIVSGEPELQVEGTLDYGGNTNFSGLVSQHSLWNGVSDDLAELIEQSGAGNLTNVDPLLEAVADNGGFTPTRLPAADSPVIDAGDPDPTGTPALDQRGHDRINGVVDMGSVEAGTRATEPGDEEPDEPGDEQPDVDETDGEQAAPVPGVPDAGAPKDPAPAPSGDDPVGDQDTDADAAAVVADQDAADHEAAELDGLASTGAAGIWWLVSAGGVALLAGLALVLRARRARGVN